MFYQALISLCNERNVRITSLISSLGISSGNLSKWKAGGVPKSDTVSQIADYFGVSTDYLLGRTDKKGPATESGGEPSKAELVYRSLPPEKQEEALRYMEYLAEHKGK